jgi:hypothetical protein
MYAAFVDKTNEPAIVGRLAFTEEDARAGLLDLSEQVIWQFLNRR